MFNLHSLTDEFEARLEAVLEQPLPAPELRLMQEEVLLDFLNEQVEACEPDGTIFAILESWLWSHHQEQMEGRVLEANLVALGGRLKSLRASALSTFYVNEDEWDVVAKVSCELYLEGTKLWLVQLATLLDCYRDQASVEQCLDQLWEATQMLLAVTLLRHVYPLKSHHQYGALSLLAS